MQNIRSLTKSLPLLQKGCSEGSGWDHKLLNKENLNCVFWPMENKLRKAAWSSCYSYPEEHFLGTRVLQRAASKPGNTALDSTRGAEANLRQQDAFPRRVHTPVRERRGTPRAAALKQPPSFGRLFVSGLLRQEDLTQNPKTRLWSADTPGTVASRRPPQPVAHRILPRSSKSPRLNPSPTCQARMDPEVSAGGTRL